jgi:hypothetical protein
VLRIPGTHTENHRFRDPRDAHGMEAGLTSHLGATDRRNSNGHLVEDGKEAWR